MNVIMNKRPVVLSKNPNIKYYIDLHTHLLIGRQKLCFLIT